MNGDTVTEPARVRVFPAVGLRLRPVVVAKRPSDSASPAEPGGHRHASCDGPQPAASHGHSSRSAHQTPAGWSCASGGGASIRSHSSRVQTSSLARCPLILQNTPRLSVDSPRVPGSIRGSVNARAIDDIFMLFPSLKTKVSVPPVPRSISGDRLRLLPGNRRMKSSTDCVRDRESANESVSAAIVANHRYHRMLNRPKNTDLPNLF
jgi:hypothetical protein